MLITPAVLSDSLAAQVESVCRDLLPLGKKMGHEWCVGSVSGEEGESLKVHLTGDKAGLWSDFAEGGKGGDLLDLMAAVHGIELKEAIKMACQFLGIERPQFEGHKKRTYKRPEKPKDLKSITAPKAEPVLAWLESRLLTQKTIDVYKVVAKDRDTVVFPYLRDGELIHLKYRNIHDKSKMWTSADSEKCLFGWQAIPPKARSVVITEGELDAMTMFQYGYPAMSVPFGGGKAGKQEWIENEFENLERFDTIYVCMDADREGALALAEIVDRLSRHRCKVVELPFKDANDCLREGLARDTIDTAIRAAKTLDPRELRNAAEYLSAVVDRFYPSTQEARGFGLPWFDVGRFVCGWGETTIIAGYNGHGKTTVIGHIVAEVINQSIQCCVASLEFRPGKWIAALVRQVLAAAQPDRQHIEKAIDWLAPYLWAFDVSGKGMGTAKVERLLEVFSYARARYGCKVFVIDNLAKLGLDEDDYNGQKKAMVAITEFAVEHDVHVILAAHLRKAESDQIGGGKMGVRGSSTIVDLPDNVFEVRRNRRKEVELVAAEKLLKEAEDGDDVAKVGEDLAKLKGQADTYLNCEKARNHDEEPRLGLWFDKESHQFLTLIDGKPRTYA
jgi:twinkle protein